jgi:hypothetical protein
MNTDRRTILAMVATGRITPAEAERLLLACNDSREVEWIAVLCLAFACLAQLHMRELLPDLTHFIYAQVPALAEAVRHALSPISNLMGGLL